MFSFKRFSEQFKINVIQNARKHGMYILALGLLFIYANYKYFESGGYECNNLFNSAGFLISIISIFHSIDVFGKLRRTDSGIHYLMMPASTTDKYLAAWLYSTLFTFVVYLITFYAIHSLAMILGNSITGLSLPYQFLDSKELWGIFKLMLFYQAFYFLGALVFRKNPFIKTTAVLIGCNIAIGIIGVYIVKHYFADFLPVNNNNSVNFNMGNWINNNKNGLNLPEEIEYYVNLVRNMLYIIPFICWSAAYLKLKKTEI